MRSIIQKIKDLREEGKQSERAEQIFKMIGQPKDAVTKTCFEILEDIIPNIKTKDYADIYIKPVHAIDVCLRKTHRSDPGIFSWDDFRNPTHIKNTWEEYLSKPLPTAIVVETSLSDTRQSIVVKNGTSHISVENDSFLAERHLWIGGTDVIRIEHGIYTTEMILERCAPQEVQRLQWDLTELTPSKLMKEPSLQTILKELRSGPYNLRAMQISFVPYKLNETVDMGIYGSYKREFKDSFVTLQRDQQKETGPNVYVSPVQPTATLDRKRIEHFRQLPLGQRGTVVMYSHTFYDGFSEQAVALFILDGHHKFAAAVESGEPADILIISPTHDGETDILDSLGKI